MRINFDVGSAPTELGRKLGLAGVLGALLLLCAFAPPALASPPTWLTPVSLSAAGQDAQTPVVAMDGNGDSEAVWTRSDGTNPILQTSFREAGPGDTFAEQDVNASNDSVASSTPQVSQDQFGDAEAVWVQDGEIWWSWRTNDVFGFGVPGSELDFPNTGESDPQVAVDSNGDVVAAWLWNDTHNVAGLEVVDRS